MNNVNIGDNIKNSNNHLQVEFLYDRITLRMILILQTSYCYELFERDKSKLFLH